MRKILLIVILIIACNVSSRAQNIIIQQNNQQQQEKVIIKEKKVPVYVKEKSTELTQPVLIYGYLYVYPEDLGRFRVRNFPYDVVRNINRVRAYGRDTWRLPTKEELSIMYEVNGGAYNQKGKLRLDAGIGCSYMCQDGYGYPIKYDANDYYSPDSYQKIRLVSTQ